IEKYGRPEIFNTDQGSQFTSDAFIDVLKSNDIQISMDGKGRWVDNVMVERLWRSVKYEEVYLKAYSNVLDAKKGEFKHEVRQFEKSYDNQQAEQISLMV
ncbi:integrase core domain protein, partial [Acinetobacter sp. 25977_7]